MKEKPIIQHMLYDFKRRASLGRNLYTPVPMQQDTEIHPPLHRPHRVSLNAFATVDSLLAKISFFRGKDKTKCVVYSMIMGLFAFILAGTLYVFSPYDIVVGFKSRFREGSEAFEMWQQPPVDVYLKVYLYNVTNKENFLAGIEPLSVQQVGPYVYKETVIHANASFNPENGTVFAIPKVPLTWVAELSAGREDDVLILPNVALLSFANVISDASILTRTAVNVLIRKTGTEALVEQTAKEFMFGYESTLVTLGNNFMPSWIVFDKLGLIDRMYDFVGDTSNTYTDGQWSGTLDTYNGLPYLPQWKEPCNRLQKASDGTKFPAGDFQRLLFFRKSLCRAMPLERTSKKYAYINGIPTFRYHFADNAMDNGLHNKENTCFCRNGQCLPQGLLDVTSCYYGFPIALSYPHFFKSNESLLKAVHGLNPSRELHETYFYINPVMGAPAKLSVKMQINLALKDLNQISNSEAFSNLVVPLLWTNIEMQQLETTIILKLVLLLRILPVIETALFYLSLIGGAAFVLLSICALLFSSDGTFYSQAAFNSTFTNHLLSHHRTKLKGSSNDLQAFAKSVPVDHNRNNTHKNICRTRSSLVT